MLVCVSSPLRVLVRMDGPLTVMSISSSARIRAAYDTASSEVDIVRQIRCASVEYCGSSVRRWRCQYCEVKFVVGRAGNFR